MSDEVQHITPSWLQSKTESVDPLNPLYQLIYTSSTDQELDESDLISLLAKSREKNSTRSITGLLLYSHSRFIQVLEGPKDAVEDLYQSIQLDSRHQRLICLTCYQLKHRDFADWAMGFRRLGQHDFNEALPGFSDIVEAESINLKMLSGISIRVGFVLKHFSDSMRLNNLMPHS